MRPACEIFFENAMEYPRMKIRVLLSPKLLLPIAYWLKNKLAKKV